MKNWIIVSILVLTGSNTALADAPPASAQACVACHGENGVSDNPQWPNLAGQHAGYLAIQLKAFKDGSRSNQAMAPFITGLTDSDIAELAEYYSSQAPAVAASGAPALVAAGESLSCY